MNEGKQISIRISVDEYNFAKKMNANLSEIWRIGFEKWALEFPVFLQKKAQEYKNLYIQCIDKTHDCIDNVYTKNRDLDEIYRVYVEQGRSVQQPHAQDRSWVKARISKLKNHVSVEQFFEYCKKRFEDERQKKLEVEK